MYIKHLEFCKTASYNCARVFLLFTDLSVYVRFCPFLSVFEEEEEDEGEEKED